MFCDWLCCSEMSWMKNIRRSFPRSAYHVRFRTLEAEDMVIRFNEESISSTRVFFCLHCVLFSSVSTSFEPFSPFLAYSFRSGFSSFGVDNYTTAVFLFFFVWCHDKTTKIVYWNYHVRTMRTKQYIWGFNNPDKSLPDRSGRTFH